MAKKQKGFNLEEKIIHLEKIANQVDNGDVNINEMVDFYKSSVKLTQECIEEITKIEQEIIEFNL